MSFKASVARYVPAVHWLAGYQRNDLSGDVNAGLTVAVMLVPQAMAYAMLAGLPPIVGLYASTVPLVVYALLGTSRQLAVGPVAMVSLLVASAVGALEEPGTETFIAYATTLALLVGAIQFLMGALRLGFLVRLLSHPVISGFTSAAALIIAFSQLGGLLGIKITRSHHIHKIVIEATGRIGEFQGATIAIGVLAIVLFLVVGRLKPAFPAALVAAVVGTLATWLLRLDQSGVRVVGDVPAGFPRPSLPRFDLDTLESLIPIALIISFVGFMESIAVAKAVAAKHRYEIAPNQELVALGAANLAGSVLGAYPVTGGFSRTAVNDQAGARTGLASIITAGIVALTLLFLTPLFYYLPVAILSAIIFVAAMKLVDLPELQHLWRLKRTDAFLLIVTFLATLGFGIERGILIGIGASLALFIVRTTRPHTAVLGQLPGQPEVFRNVDRFPEAQRIPGLVILRVDATFYFANMDFLKDHLSRIEQECSGPFKGLIIDASSINDLDSSAVRALEEIARAYGERGVQLYFASVKGPVRDIMKRAGFYERLGEDAFTFTIRQAVDRFTLARSVITDENAQPC